MNQESGPARAVAADLVIRGVTVVGTRDGSCASDQDVLIGGGRILATGPARGQVNFPGARVVEAGGKHLVPGFADMHVHMPARRAGMCTPAAFDLMLAYGVTGFRQMSGSARMLADRAAGTLMPAGAPRLLAMPGEILTPLNAGTEAAAAAAIRQQHDLGADFIKAGLVTSDVFYAVQAQARRLGTAVLGHLPRGIDVARASGEGIRSVEHLGPGAALLACCTASPDVRERIAGAPGTRMPALPAFLLPVLRPVFSRIVARLIVSPVNRSRQADVDILQQVTEAVDQDAAAALAQRFVRDGTWQVPTLIRSRTGYLGDDPAFRDEPGLRFIAPATLRRWSAAARTFGRFPASSKQTFRAVYAAMLHLTRMFDAAGVKMLTGSDVGGAAWEVPGIALHQEFDELASAGLPPLRILQMTTLDAAEFLGTTDVMGSVEAGKYADLVLLDGDPVRSAANLHRISGVVRDGRYYAHADLDAIKQNIATRRSVR
jgi:imidazolonepropionase-like amidohydrolase